MAPSTGGGSPPRRDAGPVGALPYRWATEERWLEAAAAPATPRREYLTFLVGDEEYAIDIQRIREIIKVRPVTEVPHAPPFLLGVIAVRGVVLPVLDLRRRLHLPAGEPAGGARFLIVRRAEDEHFGLLVDEVRQVAALHDGEIEPPPATLSAAEAELVAGIGRPHGRMVILLQLDGVLRFEVGKRLAQPGAGARAAGDRDTGAGR